MTENTLDFALKPYDSSITKRLTNEALEDMLYEPMQCLDKGFVRLIDYMGGDEAIVQAARVSYGGGTKKVSEDRGLIRYLLRHRHTTPLEMCEIKFHCKMPIFIARQWIRHRTANVNEISARYSILVNEFYIPHSDNIMPQSTNNKQGRDGALTPDQAQAVMSLLTEEASRTYANYRLLNGEKDVDNWRYADTEYDGEQQSKLLVDGDFDGIARELARMGLSLNMYTEWYWKIDLHNLLHFLCLRLDSHAQYEIRVFAEAMAEVVKAWCPAAYEAFEDYRLNSAEFSAQELAMIKDALAQAPAIFKPESLSTREYGEFNKKLGLD